VVRKEFVVTEKQLKFIRAKADKLGISQNEMLRRLLDIAIEHLDLHKD